MSQDEINRIAENAFWIMCHIMIIHKQRDVLKSGLPGLHKNIEKFQEKIQVELPKLHYHLMKNNVITMIFVHLQRFLALTLLAIL